MSQTTIPLAYTLTASAPVLPPPLPAGPLFGASAVIPPRRRASGELSPLRLRPLAPDHVPDGPVYAWSPVALECTEDARVISPDQRSRLASYSGPLDSDENPWIGWAVQLQDACAPTVAETIKRYVDRHETLRIAFSSGVAHTGRQLVAPGAQWEPRLIADGADACASYATIAAHLATTIGPDGWPPFAFITIGELGVEPGELVLLGAFDHICYDGLSAYSALTEVPGIHAGVIEGQQPPPAAPSHVDHAHDQAMSCAALSRDDVRLQPWWDVVHSEAFTALPAPLQAEPGRNYPQLVDHLFIADKDMSDAFAHLMKQKGLSQASAFSAVLLRALAVQGNPELALLISQHGRPSREWATAAGWFASVSPVRLAVEHTGSIEQIAGHLQQSGRSGAAHTPLATVSDLLGVPVEPALVLSYVCGPQLEGYSGWNASQARLLISNAPPGHQIHAWVSRMDEGTWLDIRYPRTENARQWVTQLTMTMQELVEASLRDGRI